ncbi:MAG: hypothetical protein IH598_08870 [Bacteroidales bacterium]|nr:hypothetical protein [Bacteroidales bacterium]
MLDVIGKLKIIAFKTPKFMLGGPPVGGYLAMFNPESFSVSQKVLYDLLHAPGITSGEPAFRGYQAQVYKFDFLVDGTGASGESREVFADVLLFKYTVGYLGEIHRPHYLIIQWGTFIARCVLSQMDVKYDLFRQDGTPLRATISATFIEHVESMLESLLANRSSPDLTHTRVVREGDTLPLLAHEIYGDASYYPEVARVNGIDNFRKLKIGDEIYFPPLTSND